MVRILQMIGSLNVGGSQTMILNLYRNIDREKIQFDFVLDHPDERYFAADAEALGARIYNLPGFTGFNAHEVKTAWDSFLTRSIRCSIPMSAAMPRSICPLPKSTGSRPSSTAIITRTVPVSLPL